MAYETSDSIKIAATPENVWAVLADLDKYPQWHPSFQSVTGQLAVGSTLTIRTASPNTGNPITLKVKVLAVEADIELVWDGHRSCSGSRPSSAGSCCAQLTAAPS